MRFVGATVIGCLLLALPVAGTGEYPREAVQNVLEQQVAAWNRGDLKQFVSSYAEHCTLVGNSIMEISRDQVLAHYQQKYPSSDARGKLAFSGLIIHQVDDRVATVTGHWHIDRKAALGGGHVDGVFSLVLTSIDGSWQIALDHTS